MQRIVTCSPPLIPAPEAIASHLTDRLTGPQTFTDNTHVIWLDDKEEVSDNAKNQELAPHRGSFPAAEARYNIVLWINQPSDNIPII